jgi:peroxiredoxin Q/BCP
MDEFQEFPTMMKLAAMTALLAFGVLALMAIAGRREELNPGDAAPDFSLPGSDGKTHNLASLKGRTVVLAWFPKAFTGG